MEKHTEEVRSSPVQRPQSSSNTGVIFMYLAPLVILLGLLCYFGGLDMFKESPSAVFALLKEAILGDASSDRLSKRKAFTDQIGFRVLVGIGVFAVLNVIVITVHHIVQKIARSTNSYKTVDHVISPF